MTTQTMARVEGSYWSELGSGAGGYHVLAPDEDYVEVWAAPVYDIPATFAVVFQNAQLQPVLVDACIGIPPG